MSIKILSLNQQRWIVIGLTAFFSLLSMISSNLVAGVGYPLDDAWIHQTYARNFAETGKWFFIDGIESGGSTSPLWTLLLSLGYLIKILSPFIWTSLLSILLMCALSLIGFEIIRNKIAASNWVIIPGSLFLGLEWHLIWSASSGMETILFCCLTLLLFYYLIEFRKPVAIGIFTGILIWVRPDGLTLIGPLLLILFWKGIKKELKIGEIIKAFIPLVIIYGCYVLFNISISDNPFPNTFYAKQFEYSVELEQALPLRIMRMFLVPISGAGVFLIPGVVWNIYRAIRKRDPWVIALFLWFIGYGSLYALKLPMIYQHGRYLMPLIPVYFVLGVIGSVNLAKSINEKFSIRISYLKLVWFGCGITTVVFGIMGQLALSKDIRVINQLLVQPARWINENTEKSVIVAAHDIGALGYFGNRPLIDLAGLIQPEIIPIIRDEEEIKKYLLEKQANYLVIFHDWYSQMNDFGVVEETFEANYENKLERVEIRNLQVEHKN